MKSLSINALLPSMLQEFSGLAVNPKAVPTEEQIVRLTTLKMGAANSALAAELGISAVGAAIGACVGELDEMHLRNLGWLLEMLGEISGSARHIEHEAIHYLRMAKTDQ
ncbi:hypothetical protein GNF76_23840 [Pseudomonas sp. CCM 7893]|uniref:Uncharacterized protein n=1 Tax=Pseudomonas spelaei TaxID=1055469 RepID=A0A6I3WJC5_9PSED|nr:hypothetical protein [Pseudomonas spelaei]MUF07389.1 hypothetical protein [Pseudomonas spelaei]